MEAFQVKLYYFYRTFVDDNRPLMTRPHHVVGSSLPAFLSVVIPLKSSILVLILMFEPGVTKSGDNSGMDS